MSNLLRAALLREVEPLDFERMKTKAAAPPLDLGADANPTPAPVWEEYAPRSPRGLTRIHHATARYRRARDEAEAAFAQAVVRHAQNERARVERVRAARARHERVHGVELRRAEQHNADVDTFHAAVLAGEARAVSDYFGKVLDGVADPHGFPHETRAGYTAESRLLVVSCRLPGMGIIPIDREFRYNEIDDTIDSSRAWSPEQVRRHYQDLISRIALRSLHLIFCSDPDDLVQTVVFNGYVEAPDSATSRAIQPCLVTLRASRAHFRHVKLDRVDPLPCARRHFGAVVSPHPEALAEVTPYLGIDLAVPAPIPAPRSAPDDRGAAGDSGRSVPDLLRIPPEEFGQLVHQLLTRMGLRVGQVRPDGNGGIDCRAHDPAPVGGGARIIHVARTTHLMTSHAVRALASVVHQEQAVKGLLITTSGFSAGCYEYANGRPLQLYDGSSLLALCRRHRIPARLPPAGARTVPPDRPGTAGLLGRWRGPHAVPGHR